MRPFVNVITRRAKIPTQHLPKCMIPRQQQQKRTIQLHSMQSATLLSPPPSVMAGAIASNASPAITASQVAAAVTSSFYMRELPKDVLVGYETPEGKALFKQALEEGGLEAFFPLSQQFLTQNEPAFCGLGTLCMILNALKIDPAVTWRKPWRWFSQEMLDCCRPLEWVKEHGITLAEFSCLAKCNGLEEMTRYADQTSFEEFERDVKAVSQSTDHFMAVSYSRASLGQTGSGHFSPAGGYCSKNGGMVLILDVARFKYPSYWVPIRALYESLVPPDSATGQPRGYSILSRPTEPHRPSSSLLRLNATPTTWPLLYNPLKTALGAARSYEELQTTLSNILSKPTGLPAVTSRYEERIIPSTAGLDPSPSFSSNEGLQAYGDYRKGVGNLYLHFAEHCEIYRQLDSDELWKTEISVFMLAVLSLRDLLDKLDPIVRKEVIARTKKDLADSTIGPEVELVRRQMEGLVGCSKVECRSDSCCRMPKIN